MIYNRYACIVKMFINNSKKVIRRMKKNVYSLFLGVCLFIFVGISCMKAVSIGLIREAFISSAFSFRINGVICEASPEIDINDAIELQELMEKHPQLNKIIHNYLHAYAKYLDGDYDIFGTLDHEKAFQKMNREILNETKKRNPDKTLTISDEEFLAKARVAEAEVELILQDEIPYNLQNFGEMAILAINIYSVMTSLWVQIGLLFIMLLLVIKNFMQMKNDRNIIFESFGKLFVLHGCFWAVVIPAFIKIAGWRLLYIVDRFLGRSMFLDITPFLWRGGSLIVLGIFLCVFSKVLKKQQY